jgi:peptidoglycan/LPS O-acetylase OafA/YrhL
MFGTYRILLALMVVADHYARTPFIGGYAVFGFFALSGYLMTLIMQRNYGYTMRGIAVYGLNRFLRIYPLYWISCLIGLAVLLLLDPEDTTGVQANFFVPDNALTWAKNIFLIVSFSAPGIIISVAWALTVELFFYACIGLGLSRNRQLSVIWIAGSVAYTLWLLGSGAGFDARYHTIGAASLPFSTGALIYHYREQLVTTLRPLSQGEYAPPLMFALILINWAIAWKAGALESWGFYTNYLLCAAMTVCLCDRKTLRFISKQTDNRLGDLSYPIYLVHVPAAFVILAFCKWLGLGIDGPGPMIFFLSLLPLLLLSQLLAVVAEAQVEKLRTAVKRTL